ncbi:hypothetical protein BH23GEM7_BH23GEM7_07340 [soil metagenome]
MKNATALRKAATSAALLLTVGLSACYHATIDTGRRPSGETIERPWAHSFVNGLVPPATVETAGRCPNGVARVETQQSFLNGLVAALTFALYTPMTITVQCAAAGTAMLQPEGSSPVITLREGASLAELESALNAAAKRAAADDAPVYVDFSGLE